MAKNILVINVDIRETRVALIENGIIAELHLERQSAKGTLGNVYLGKVSRVLPGMQAAFIDIGQERAAFLHVEDLIRPDDFDAYLAGKRSGPVDDESTHVHAAEPDKDAPAVTAEKAAPPPQDRPADRAQDRPERERGGRRRRRGGSRDRVEPAAEAPASEGDTDLGLPKYSMDGGNAPPPAASSGQDADVADEPLVRVSDEELSDAAHVEVDDEDEELISSGADESGDDDAESDDQDDADEDRDIEVDDDADDDARDSDDGDAGDSEADDEGDASDRESDGESDDDGDDLGATDGDAPKETDDAPADDDGDASEDEGSGDDAEPAPGDAPAVDAEASTATTPAEDDAATRAPKSRSRRGSRGRRRSGSTTERRSEMQAQAPAKPAPKPAEGERQGDRRGQQGQQRKAQGKRDGRDGRAGRGDRGDRRGSSSRSAKADPLRISKTTPIRDVVREGQEVIVQVSKEPIGTKGARVTSHISLPGRYVVYLPTVEHVGISKRIGSDKERSRLREAIDAMKPPSGGLIVRTLAEGLTKKSLKADVGYLVRLWGEIARKREQAPRAPECLYAELDLVLKVARDLLNDDIEEVVIDNREEYVRLRRFIDMFMPERVEALKLYEGQEPIFDAYGIEEEIGRALSRKVPLNSGGYLIIDQAEALTAIDVNTGRFVGKGSKDLEDTILITNLEAVEEIAYQLRFRNIGGLIILDLIDMDRAANREKVRRRLEQLLAKDKAKTTLNRISELGLIEMTRKRTRESLGRLMNEPCFYCDGTGNLQSKQTVAYEILRQIKRERMTLRGYSVTVNAHPAVVDLMKNEERLAVQEAERRYQRRIDLVPRKEYHLEQFDLIGK